MKKERGFVLEQLAQIMDMMSDRRIRVLQVDTDVLLNLRIEMDESGWSKQDKQEEKEQGPEEEVEEKQPRRRPENMCSCGHDLVTEHNEAGCLFGCSAELCGSDSQQPEE